MTTEWRVNSISKITKGDEAGTYFYVECNVTIVNDGVEETFDALHVQRHEDKQGFCPLVKKWMEENPAFPIQPFVPKVLSQDEIRASMPSLTARQFRLGFVMAGHSIASIDAAIDAIADPTQREIARIEWEYATTFNRVHPLITQIATGLGITAEQIDSMWAAALNT